MATAAPAFATSGDLSVAWTNDSTELLSLRVLDGTDVVTARAAVVVPDEVTITNPGATATGNLTVTITVQRPNLGSIDITVGQARGFRVAAFNGVDTLAHERTVDYASVPVFGNVGTPITTWTGTLPSVPANTSLAIPVEFGLVGRSWGLNITLLTLVPVTIKVSDGVKEYTSTMNIHVTAGAAVL